MGFDEHYFVLVRGCVGFDEHCVRDEHANQEGHRGRGGPHLRLPPPLRAGGRTGKALAS